MKTVVTLRNKQTQRLFNETLVEEIQRLCDSLPGSDKRTCEVWCRYGDAPFRAGAFKCVTLYVLVGEGDINEDFPTVGTTWYVSHNSSWKEVQARLSSRFSNTFLGYTKKLQRSPKQYKDVTVDEKPLKRG